MSSAVSSSMPREQRVRRHNRVQFTQHLASQFLRLSCQPPALVIGETQSLTLELLPEHPIFLLQKFDDLQLLLVDPTCQSNQYDLPRTKD